MLAEVPLAGLSFVLSLVVAEGAGTEMRRTLGLAVFSGMLGVTLFGVFLTPIFFFTLLRNVGRSQEQTAGTGSAPEDR